MIGEIAPPLAQYGHNSKHLNKTEALQATRDERIRSCWGLIINNTLRFHQTLNPRQKANYSVEDILVDLWITLSERDHLWNPDRGAYSTFAWNLIHNELRNIFDRSTTVELPKDSSWRSKKYEKESKNGSLNKRKAKTYEDIKRITQPIFSLSEKASTDYFTPATLEYTHRNKDHHDFPIIFYSRIPDPKLNTPDKTLEESETQSKLGPILKSLSDKFPGQKLTNPRNRPRILKFLSELGITPDHLSSA